MQHIPAFTKQAMLVDGALAGTLTAAATFGAVGWLSLQLPHPQGGLSDMQHLQHWFAYSFSTILPTDSAQLYKDWITALSEHGVAWKITLPMHVAQACSVLAGTWAGWTVGQPRDRRIKKEGGRLVTGKDVYKYGMPNWLNKNQFGLELLPGFLLKKYQEREHFLVSGGTGSGKTTATAHMMLQAHARGDRALIFDFKGITEKWPGKFYGAGHTLKTADSIILAAHDARSAPWFIAKDVNSKQAAKDFAARLIPESKEPVFSQGARQVLTGCMCKLIKEKPLKWSFKDLSELIVLPVSDLIPIMQKHFPEAIRAVESAPVTVSGILLNLGAFAGLIHDLGELWPKAGGFSITEWVKNPDHKIRTVILKTSTEFATLSSAINNSIISAMCSLITSLPDVAPGVAPIWIWIDEFPTLGKIAGWETMMSTGRSKDFRAIMNVQSKSQLTSVWDQHVAQTWIDSIGIKLLGKNDGEGATWVSELVGSVTYSYPTYSQDSNGRRSTNWSSGTEEPLFTPNQVKTQLGKGKFIVHGIGGVELKVQFPNTMDKLPLLRKPDIPSALCFSPHRIKQAPLAPPPLPIPPDDDTDAMPVGAGVNEPKVTISEIEVEQQQESETIITQEFDLADFTKQIIAESGNEIENQVEEKALTNIVEALAGADIAHIVEIGLELNEAAESLSSDGDAQVQVLTKAERLKQRKKHKLTQELEQSV
jgi:hypothetical protein